MIQHMEMGVAAGPAGPFSPPQKGQRCSAQAARPRQHPGSHRSMVLSLFRSRRASSFELLLSSCCCSRNFICFCREASTQTATEAPGIVGEASQLMRTAGSWERTSALNSITASAAWDYGELTPSHHTPSSAPHEHSRVSALITRQVCS